MRRILAGALLLICCVVAGCSPADSVRPSLEFTLVPEAGPGGPKRMEPIAGVAKGARRGQRIVLFAKSGKWWVQPTSAKPFTDVGKDGQWKASTHLGTHYAALLVEPTFVPPTTSDSLPPVEKGVLASVTVAGTGAEPPAQLTKRIQFSGYEWEVRQAPSDRGGTANNYSPANVWTDDRGWLHLRISKEGGEWACAEVNLLSSLGYGTYTFQVRNVPRLEPSTVLGMFTWDDLESGQNHREIDIELSQWGDPESKNSQFVIQPYYVPANVFRFHTPAGPATFSLRWEPGRIRFRAAGNQDSGAFAEHQFTSGVPFPGGETVHINLYLYGKSRTPQLNENEVVIERFEFLP